MSGLRKWFDEQSFIVKLLLVLFLDPIICGLYRIAKGDTSNIILGIAWFITGGLFGIGWVIDLIFVIMKKPFWEL